MPMWAKPLPILVGLSGKRDLGGQDAAAAAALDAAFDRIDAAFPHAPKVLVTGLAAGADMLATEIALRRRAWRGFALLPFAREAYAGTIRDAGGDDPMAQFDALLLHPKLRYGELPALPPSDAGHGPAYEQLGLWLATNCAILLAVMPGTEEPGLAGGTARVVAHRLRGEADAAAAAVIATSLELAQPPGLKPPEPQGLCLVDLAGPVEAGALPLRLRAPDGKGGSRDRTPTPDALRRAFPTAVAIESYNRRGATWMRQGWPEEAPDALAALQRFRDGMSSIQGGCQRAWRYGVFALAALFLVAVAMIEAHVKFTEHWHFAEAIGLPRWSAAAYVGLVGGAIGLHLLSRRRRWQMIHQDYRAVIELLRVQGAFWAAGLTGARDRVDLHTLVGASGTLRQVRRSAGAIIAWIGLSTAPAEPRWSWITGPDGWIREQIAYFTDRAAARERRMQLVGVLSWGAFFLALGLSLWLAVEASGDAGKGAMAALSHRLNDDPLKAHGMLAVVVGLCFGAWWLRVPPAEPRLSPVAAVAVPVGFLLLPPALETLAAALGGTHEKAGHDLVIVALVVLLATAGAIRFVAEKLVWEAEGHAYAEALARFREAGRRLQAIEALPEEEREAHRQAVVRDLGRAALAEGEGWLRAHRERPLEPLVGG
ncbi:MAG: hypothetical protein ACOYOH_04445 [Paracraurococcus sp.]